MSETNLEDEDLFGEAASEMRADVADSLAAARAALPAADDVWSVDADNTLGVLNALRSTLDPEGARDYLRDAKKWYTMGERADAFDAGDELAAEIEDVEALLADLEDAREGVGDLAATLPQVRSTLQEAETAGADADAEAAEPDATEAGDAAGEEGADADVEPEGDAEAEA